MKEVEEAQLIYTLYSDRKQDKKKRKIVAKDSQKRDSLLNKLNEGAKFSSDDEEGEINEKKIKVNETIANEVNQFEGIPSISNLGEHIRPLTLTRNKICDLLNSRRFE